MIRPLLAALLSIAGASAALADPLMTRDYPVAGFDRIDLKAAAGIEVHSGAGFAIHASGAPELVQRLEVTRQGDTLVIGWTPGAHPMHIRREDALRLTIAMPRIAGATISGAGSIVIDRVEGPDFTAMVGGAGSLKLPAMRTGHAALTVGGAGSIVAAGSAGNLDARVSGVGSIDSTKLTARGGRVEVSGTGSIKARVDGRVVASMSGIGSVTVTGHPLCEVHKSGLGSVHCGA